uniref:Uncharacterized protein n=1 Tax=Arcella intermedia TaxID=1963864 RepID=A0A6B2L9C7_9EUKA
MCLGIGGCGKTTFVKQMKIIHGVSWDESEKERFVQLIRRNYLLVLGDILSAIQRLKLNLSEEGQKNADRIKELLKDRECSIKDNIAVLKSVWEDPTVQDLVTNHKEQINAPLISYFWEHVDRVMSDTYVPTEDDILRVRVRTAGAYSTTVYVKPEYFEFFDVGGQKPERSKWEKVLSTHKFSCVIFFVATDEWDVKDEEREFDATKLEMSKIIFTEVTQTEMIDASVPIILFLNRSDLLGERIKSASGFASFKEAYPEYAGEQKAEAVLGFIKDRFLEGVNRKKDGMKHYVTNALDKNSMTPVFNAVKTYILTSSLSSAGVDY